MNVSEPNTESAILEAARKLFGRQGFAGVSLQDIAKEAGTTKSMINYYFRSKEKLFTQIFRQEFQHLFTSIGMVMASDLSLKEKISQIIQLDMDKLIQMPQLPVFILSELHRNTDIILKDLENIPIQNLLLRLEKDIDAEVKKGKINKIEPLELMMNIQSLTIYPIVAKPMLIHRLGITEKNYHQMMQKRKAELADLIWKSILK